MSSFLGAADLDGDGLDDAWESANGCDPSTVTRVVYVDAENGDDETGDGVSASTALKSLGAALDLEFSEAGEVVVLVAPGTYCGAGNRELDFGGRDIRLRSLGGASQTVVDLEGAGRFLSLTGGETLSSVLEGFTVRNGYRASNGTAVHLSNSSLTIRDCVFEDNRSGKKVEYDYGTWTYVQLMDAQSTAAVYAEGAPVQISGTVFRRNASAETMYSSMGVDNAGALLLSNADGSIVEECQFLGNSGHGGGAVALHGTDATFRGCAFRRNISLYYGGGLSAFQSRNSGTNAIDVCDVILENCLFLGNKAFQDYSDVYFGTGTTAALKHITASGGTSKNGNALRFGGETAVSNSILDGKVSLESGIVFAADHCCAKESLSAYGEGNLQGDPSLSGAGWLLSSSVCRGAGGATGFLSSDIAGNPRSETVVDLGCRAFVDTDADGIPDDVEIVAGLDPSNAADATGDRDGDGVLNLQEYEQGTDLDNADTDGDGISDATELSQGLDPLWPVRFLFVSPTGEDENDGLSLETPKATLTVAVESAKQCGWDNVVELAAGEYSGEGFRGLDFGGYDIIVRGAGASATVVDLGGAGRFLSASGCETAASRVEGLTLRNGSGDSGSAISVSGAALTLRRCAIEDCAASWFGTLFVSNAGSLCVEECAFQGNTAYYGGAIAAQGEASLSVTDSEMRGNTATSDGGALYLDCASAEVSASRFFYNHAAGCGGGITLSGDAALEMTNCLAIGDSAAGGSRDLHCDSSLASVSLMNCTFADDAGGGVSCSLQGQMELLNCAFAGEVSFNGGQPFASHNCTPADWSQYGTGNVAADLVLTSSGMPKAGSPCIDAGDGFVAPEKDIDGRIRPSGTAVDIGCFEFQDSDADGIPDAVEGTAELSPSGDEDGDGLVNLREYLLGTDIFQADTDGDGIDDGEEVSGGYDPLLVTRVTYVDPVAGNDANDGRSAENAKRTLSAAVEISRRAGCENVILAAPGVYSGASNRGLDFSGYDIRLVASAGASETIVDLEGAGRLLFLTKHESLVSSLEGFTVRNGYMASNGTAVHLNGASLTIRDCVFENNSSGRLETYDTGNGQTYSNWEGGYSSAAVYSSNGKVRIIGSVFRNNASHNTTEAGMDAGSAGAILLCNADGCVVEECDFVGNSGYGAGAIVASNASLEVRRSRFLHNFSYSNGGAVSAPEGWYYYGSELFENDIVLENCLFLENRALQDFSDLDVADERSLVTLWNTTFSGGSAKSGHALRLAGTATVANCIVDGLTTLDADVVLSASNNCVGDDWSAYGSGNFAGEPMLTGAGMLKAGSPCVDAGTSIGAPAEDLFRNARPVGDGVDIGCHEFQDEDADGIADFCEGLEGVLPGNDEDGDGLTNLEEYLLGTDIFKADTDGDGMDDGEEVSSGRNPVFPTRVIHVSPDGDDANDGLTASTAKATIAAAVEFARTTEFEGIVLLGEGTYVGAGNRDIDFQGHDIRIVAASGDESVVIDLEGAGRFLSLSNGETFASSLEGLTIRNGYMASNGTAVHLNGASLAIRDCVFENNSSGRLETYDTGNGQTYSNWEGGYSSAAVYSSNGKVRIIGSVFRNNASHNTTGAGMDTGSAGAILLCNADGCVVEECDFVGNSGYGAGAIVVSNASLEVRRSRFLHNFSYTNGGAVSAPEGWYYYGSDAFENDIVLENCLCLGNRALQDFSDLDVADERSLVTLRNTTFSGGSAKSAHALRLAGTATVANCIVDGLTTLDADVVLSASNNCVGDDWSAYGSGNFVGEPMLTGAGMLKAGSPCGDAGTVIGAPAEDLFGNARPVGEGVDIGCHEFQDEDADGIADFCEGLEGVLPGNDEDGDGLTNLEEYLLGTDIFKADTDGDGMDDGEEMSNGRDPLLFANVVYVSPSGNDESDGRSPATAKATFAGALEVARQYGTENIVYAAAGSYAGQGNSSLDFEGYDIAICGTTGEERPVIDLVEGNAFLTLSQGESCRSCLKGLSFVRNRGDSPAIVLNGASLTVIDCSFRSFARSEAVDFYMCYDYDFTTAGVLRGQDATCRLEGVEVAYCSYHPARPLFVGVQSDFTLEGCRIVGNETGSAPLFRLHDSQAHMENTMLSKNNVSSAGGIAFLDGSTLLRTVNSTFAQNAPSVTSSIYGGGTVKMLNTIYEGRFSECEVLLSHCFVAPEYADASSGCISGEVALAGGLFLTSESPCIDAGLAIGAPAVDFAGTPRPQGAGVDIGCEEYRDSNGDGISDFYSAWCGGDLTPDGDLDGDGLSNLQEMFLGTDAATADTDGDGMSDGWEVLVGLSPLHDDADEDPDDDGLLNVEEFDACTNPMEADTDGDGQTDGWEVRTAFSDPTVADFNGVSDAVLEVAGSFFTDSGGGWDAVEGGACARGRSGWIQYSVQVPRDGVYLLEWNVSEAGTSSAGAFYVSCQVGGASCGALLRIPLDESQTGTGVFMAPFLSTGLHTVRLDWDNVYRNTSLRVDSLRLIELGGPDADDDGVPDWVETRLANMSCTVLPERSRVSPVCVEGANASYIEAIDVSGYYVAPEEEDPQPAIRRIAGNRWWVDLPLSPDDATPVTVSVSYQNSAMTISGNILWETVDTTTLDEDSVRLNDEMLFCADLPEGVEEWRLGIGGESHPMERGAVFRHKFEVAGDVAISASWTEADGTECSNEAVIHVLTADFGSEPICHVGTERTWRVSGVCADIPVEIDREVQSTDLGCSDGSRRFLLRGTVPAVAYATARVREGGAVLNTTAVHVVETTTHLGDGYHRVIADYGDGTVLYDGYVVVGQVVEGMSVMVTLWGTNSTFEDGTQEKTFTWENFDASGELHFSILGGRAFTTCMTVVLYQDDEVVWRLQ